MDPLSEELKNLDRLGGTSVRSIQGLEAAWPKDAPIPWRDAYDNARGRARLPAFDQHDGKAVSFLEGMLAAIRIINADN